MPQSFRLASSRIAFCVAALIGFLNLSGCLFGSDEDISIEIVAHQPAGSGSGVVKSSLVDVSIDCSVMPSGVTGDCYDDFTDLNGLGSYELEAIPDTGSEFVEWGGCPQEVGNRCIVDISMHETAVVSARFDLLGSAAG